MSDNLISLSQLAQNAQETYRKSQMSARQQKRSKSNPNSRSESISRSGFSAEECIEYVHGALYGECLKLRFSGVNIVATSTTRGGERILAISTLKPSVITFIRVLAVTGGVGGTPNSHAIIFVDIKSANAEAKKSILVKDITKQNIARLFFRIQNMGKVLATPVASPNKMGIIRGVVHSPNGQILSVPKLPKKLFE